MLIFWCKHTELCLVIIQLQHILLHPLPNFIYTRLNRCQTIPPIIVGVIHCHIQLCVICIIMVRQSMPLNDVTNRFGVHAINLRTQNRTLRESKSKLLIYGSDRYRAIICNDIAIYTSFILKLSNEHNFKWFGNDKLTMSMILGTSSAMHSFRSQVGNGCSSHDLVMVTVYKLLLSKYCIKILVLYWLDTGYYTHC